jgi:hypothetical protein
MPTNLYINCRPLHTVTRYSGTPLAALNECLKLIPAFYKCIYILDLPIPVAARLLGLWVHIPLGSGMSVFCECCVLSGLGLCVGTITRPEQSYRV